MAAMEEAKTDVVVKLKREQRTKDEPLFKIMCHCLHYLVYNTFFFENAKIWVGRTTLNREKKRHGLSKKKRPASVKRYKTSSFLWVKPGPSKFLQCSKT